MAGPVGHTSRWHLGGRDATAVVEPGTVTIGDGPPRPARIVARSGPAVTVELDGSQVPYLAAFDRDTVWIGRDGDTWAVTRLRETIDRAGPAAPGAGPITSPMPGVVLAVNVATGDAVHAGQPLLAVEAMKMEHVIVTPIDGTVEAVLVKPGQHVVLDQPLAVVTAATQDSP
jgi:acetyl-CoA/propionyl-CoA carboxylase biotin carboxyl carrier protein